MTSNEWWRLMWWGLAVIAVLTLQMIACDLNQIARRIPNVNVSVNAK